MYSNDQVDMKPKMEHLETTVETVAALLGTRRFLPAAIQRDFNWESANCAALYEDIFRLFAEHHLKPGEGEGEETPEDLQTAQLIDDENSDGNDDLGGVAPDIDAPIPRPPQSYLLGPVYLGPRLRGTNEIYDGLQRITSLTIMLSVIRDRLAEHNPDWSNWLHYFVADSEGRWRLTYPEASHGDTGTGHWLREFAQTPGEALKLRQRSDASTPRGRVGGATREFRKLTQDLTQQQLASFAQFVLYNVRMIVVEIEDSQLASQAFVTTNVRGVPLTPVDIVKGRLMDAAGNSENAQAIKESWDRVKETPDLLGFMSAVDFIERRKPQGASPSDRNERISRFEQNRTPTCRLDGETGRIIRQLERHAGSLGGSKV